MVLKRMRTAVFGLGFYGILFAIGVMLDSLAARFDKPVYQEQHWLQVFHSYEARVWHATSSLPVGAGSVVLAVTGLMTASHPPKSWRLTPLTQYTANVVWAVVNAHFVLVYFTHNAWPAVLIHVGEMTLCICAAFKLSKMLRLRPLLRRALPDDAIAVKFHPVSQVHPVSPAGKPAKPDPHKAPHLVL